MGDFSAFGLCLNRETRKDFEHIENIEHSENTEKNMKTLKPRVTQNTPFLLCQYSLLHQSRKGRKEQVFIGMIHELRSNNNQSFDLKAMVKTIGH